MKKILIIASTPLKSDGLTKIEMDVISRFKERVQFELACSFGFDNIYGKIITSWGVACHKLSRKKSVLAYMMDIYKLVKRNRYDGVYIHGNSAIMCLEALPAKLAKAKVITHCHNTKSDFPFVHYAIKPLFNMVVDVKIGCSPLASSWAYCGKRIHTILNGVDVDKFVINNEIRSSIRKQLQVEDKLVFGHVGRFERQKNHDKLIEIFREIRSRRDDAVLLLIGEGELRTAIEKKVSELGLNESVKFLGVVNNVQDYYQAMDAVIMPSLFEGLSVVALEVQASGVPIVLSDSVAKETKVTKLARMISLDKSCEEWARSILEETDFSRIDTKESFIEAKMDIDTMMDQIYDCLVS